MNPNNSWQGLKRRVGVWNLKEIPHLPPVVTICILSPLLSSTILLHCGTIWPNRSGSNFPTYRLVAWRHQPSAEPVLTNHQMRFSFAPESDSTRGLMNWTWVRRLHFLKYYHIPEKTMGWYTRDWKFVIWPRCFVHDSHKGILCGFRSQLGSQKNKTCISKCVGRW